MRKTDRVEIAWVFCFGVDANAASGFGARCLGQSQYFLERRHLKLPVIRRIGLTQLRQPLLRAQRLELGQREIFGKPAGHFLTVNGLGRLAVRKPWFRRNIGCFRNLVLVPRHQHAVFGQHKIGFDKVCALIDSELVGSEGMLGPLTASPAMSNNYGMAVKRSFHGVAFRG